MVYDVKIVDLRDEVGTVECKAHVGERLVAEAEIVFAHMNKEDEQFRGVDQKSFVFSLNLLLM